MAGDEMDHGCGSILIGHPAKNGKREFRMPIKAKVMGDCLAGVGRHGTFSGALKLLKISGIFARNSVTRASYFGLFYIKLFMFSKNSF